MTTTTTKARTDRQALRAAWAAERTAARDARRHGDDTDRVEAPRTGPHPEPAAWPSPTCGPTWRCSRPACGDTTAPRCSDSSFASLVAAPGSWTGRYPVGNTGGADVSALRPMPIPDDLRASSSTRPP